MEKKNESARRLYGIVLAAGESSRMGEAKALLKIRRKNFAQVIIKKMREAGVNDIYMVLGSGAEKIRKNLNLEKVNIIINLHWSQGQLSSLKEGIKSIPEDAAGVLVCLIDHPLVKRTTIEKMIKAFYRHSPDGIIPLFNERGGHPVIFSRRVFGALFEIDPDKGAKTVVCDSSLNFLKLEVDDPYIRQDIDTPGEYRKIGK